MISPEVPRPTLAALATVPGRPLAAVLKSLRTQVDEIAVYLNGFLTVPQIVQQYADRWLVDPENRRGAEGKLAWTDTWNGLYCSCDDDLEYPPDYVATMRAEVEHWDSRALVTAHGRTYLGAPRDWRHVADGFHHHYDQTDGQWINYGGTGCMAFDTRLRVPAIWEGRNCADAQVARWAQDHAVPIRLLGHPAGWLRSLVGRTADTRVYRQDQATGFKGRNGVLRSWENWRVYEPEVAV